MNVPPEIVRVEVQVTNADWMLTGWPRPWATLWGSVQAWWATVCEICGRWLVPNDKLPTCTVVLQHWPVCKEVHVRCRTSVDVFVLSYVFVLSSVSARGVFQ